MKRIWTPEGVFWLDLFRLACHGLTMAVLLGFFGGIIPVGDSLAVFRIEFTVLLALAAAIALYLGRALLPATGGLTVALSIWSMLPFMGEGALSGPADLRLHQHNVLYGNDDLDQLIAEVSKIDADILTFQEISETNFTRLEAGLLDQYPHYQVCLYNRGGVAVMMRSPGSILEHGCAAKGRMAWMQVETEHGPVTAVSVHQLWPWPKGQFWQKEILSEAIAELPAPVIMAGDFNNVPWAFTVRSTAKAAKGRVAKGLERSYLFKWAWPRFRIDHVVAPIGANVKAVLTPGWGSDHRGVTADIQLEPADD